MMTTGHPRALRASSTDGGCTPAPLVVEVHVVAKVLAGRAVAAGRAGGRTGRAGPAMDRTGRRSSSTSTPCRSSSSRSCTVHHGVKRIARCTTSCCYDHVTWHPHHLAEHARPVDHHLGEVLRWGRAVRNRSVHQSTAGAASAVVVWPLDRARTVVGLLRGARRPGQHPPGP